MHLTRYEKPPKNYSFFVIKKEVETYSSFNAVAQNLEKEVPLDHPSIIMERKAKTPEILTDIEWQNSSTKTYK